MSHRPSVLARWCLLCIFCVACDDKQNNEEQQQPDTESPDGIADGITDGNTEPPCPNDVLIEGVCAPTPPSLPDWQCSQGWTPTPALTSADNQPLEIEGAPQFMRCDPPSFIEPPTTCEPGFMPKVGEPSCAPHGHTCPAPDQPWPAEADIQTRAPEFLGRVWYVDPSAPDSGTFGTRTAPFKTIQTALRSSNQGDIIALSRGTFSEDISINRGIALVGACIPQTVITPTSPHDTAPTLAIDSPAPPLLTDFTLSGPRLGLQINPSDAPVTAQNLTIRQTTGLGVFLNADAQATLQDVWITDTQPKTSDQKFGYAINTAARSNLTLQDVSLTHNTSLGAFIGGGTLIAQRVLFADTQPSLLDQSGGSGLSVNAGNATLTNSVFLKNHFTGALFTDSDLTAQDVFFVDTQPRASNGWEGEGLRALENSTIDLSNAVFLRNHGAGLYALSSTLNAQHIYVADTQDGIVSSESAPGLGLSGGYGLVLESTQATIQNLTSLKNKAAGVFVSSIDATDAPSQVTLTNAVIADTSQDEMFENPAANLEVQGQSEVNVSQAVLLRALGNGVHVQTQRITPTPPSVLLSDVLIADTQPAPKAGATAPDLARLGVGLLVTHSVLSDTSPSPLTLRLERTLLTHNHGVGLAARGRSVSLNATDTRITHTQHTDNTYPFGIGIFWTAGALSTATLTRVALTHNIGIGLYSSSGELSLSAQDLLITDTQPTPDLQDLGAGLWIEPDPESPTEGNALLKRTTFARNQFAAIVAANNTLLTMQWAKILDTKPSACAATTCANEGAGAGLILDTTARADLSDFEILRNAWVGLLIASKATVQARDGIISENTIGLSVTNPQVNLATDFINVLLFSNNVDQDFSQISIPSATTSLQAIEDLAASD